MIKPPPLSYPFSFRSPKVGRHEICLQTALLQEGYI
jgi:hypothetical protein